MNCWHCGSEMIWGGDNTFDEVGIEGEGVASNFSCSNCDCYADFFCPMSEDDTVIDTKEIL